MRAPPPPGGVLRLGLVRFLWTARAAFARCRFGPWRSARYFKLLPLMALDALDDDHSKRAVVVAFVDALIEILVKFGEALACQPCAFSCAHGKGLDGDDGVV